MPRASQRTRNAVRTTEHEKTESTFLRQFAIMSCLALRVNTAEFRMILPVFPCYTAHKCRKCRDYLHGMYGVQDPVSDNELRRVCNTCSIGDSGAPKPASRPAQPAESSAAKAKIATPTSPHHSPTSQLSSALLSQKEGSWSEYTPEMVGGEETGGYRRCAGEDE